MDQATRARLAEIERNINDDIYVKGVMIDIEEITTLSESTLVNMDLV